MLTAGTTHGPGYPSPMDAMLNGPRETLLYVITVNPDQDNEDGDYLSTIDADPASETYSQVIHRTYTKRKGKRPQHFVHKPIAHHTDLGVVCSRRKRAAPQRLEYLLQLL